MLEPFSNSYFLDNREVIPYDGTWCVIQDSEYDAIQSEYVDTDPLLYKVGTHHLYVYPRNDILSYVLAVPRVVFTHLQKTRPESISAPLVATEEAKGRLERLGDTRNYWNGDGFRVA